MTVLSGKTIPSEEGGGGGGGGSGTVTSFSAIVPSEMTQAVANPTTVPALTIGWASASGRKVIASPSDGSSGAYAGRALVAGDIPDLSATYQPLDADLTAIAALSTTSYGRGFLTQAASSNARSYLGLVIGTDVQAFSSKLATFAALADAAGVLTSDGAGNYSWGAGGGGFAGTIVNLTDGSTIAIDANNWGVAGTCRVTITADGHTFGAPSNPHDNQTMRLEILTSASHTILWNAAFSGAIIALPSSTTGGGLVDELLFTYRSAESKWFLIGTTLSTGSWADVTLDNLSSVAINTTLVSDTDKTDDLGSVGSSGKRWNNVYATTLVAAQNPNRAANEYWEGGVLVGQWAGSTGGGNATGAVAAYSGTGGNPRSAVVLAATPGSSGSGFQLFYGQDANPPSSMTPALTRSSAYVGTDLSGAAAAFVSSAGLDLGASSLPWGNVFRSAYEQISVMTAPSAPGASKVRFYSDSSGGKVRLMAIFPSGAAQLIAVEP